jgi:hypothetical protein
MKKFTRKFRMTVKVLKMYVSFFAELEQVKRAGRWIKDVLQMMIMFYTALIMTTFLALAIAGSAMSTPVWVLSLSFFIFCFTYASRVFEKV